MRAVLVVLAFVFTLGVSGCGTTLGRPSCWRFARQDIQDVKLWLYLSGQGRTAVFRFSEAGVELFLGGWRGPCIGLEDAERARWMELVSRVPKRFTALGEVGPRDEIIDIAAPGRGRGTFLRLRELSIDETRSLEKFACLAIGAFGGPAVTAFKGAAPNFSARARLPESCRG